MREYANKPESQSRTLDSNPRASRQAPIADILQAYKNGTLGRQPVQRESVKDEELLRAKTSGQAPANFILQRCKKSIQRYVPEEKDELLQGKFRTAQHEKMDEDELLQGKFESTTTPEQEHVQREEKPNNTGLPDNLKTGVENLSGYSMDDIKVYYNSDKPTQLQALAYTQGTDLCVAPGQEKHLAHEAWHVVQQKQGRVRPTMQMQGVNVNDDEELEKEADVMGGRVVNENLQVNQSKVYQKIKNSTKKNKKSIPQTVQRYLIIANNDYTRQARDSPGDIDTITDTVFNEMKTALDCTNAYENEVHNFIHANTGGLVKKQIKKWIEDDQGKSRVDKGNPVFGRKQQGRSYSNPKDAAKALYGWVSAKPNRHREKELATEVYDNPVIEIHLNSLLTKIRLWIGGKPNATLIKNELDQVNTVATNWADYQNYFNINPTGVTLGKQIPSRFLDVLDNPTNYDMRNKIATLHDVMKYFMSNSNTTGAGLLKEDNIPNFKATIGNNVRSPYTRPGSSRIPRNAITRTLVNSDLANERSSGHLVDSKEEEDTSFIYARQNQIPMWARHSFTAARMMHLAKEVGGDKGEISSVAWSIMAFWRKDYDHRSIPYHTLHEIMDFIPHFGLHYNPLDREAGLRKLNVQTQLIDAINLKTNLPAWSPLTTIFRKRPAGVNAIKSETESDHTPNNKLINIKRIAHDKTNSVPYRHSDTVRFYTILDEIPDNLNLYELSITENVTKQAIENSLVNVFRAIKAFNFT